MEPARPQGLMIGLTLLAGALSSFPLSFARLSLHPISA